MKKWFGAAIALLCALLNVPAFAESGETAGEAVTAVATVAQNEISNWFVCAMGMGIVFIGLICLIVLIKILGKVSEIVAKGTSVAAAPVAVAPAPVAAAPATDAIPNRGELVAAVSAALAEELGTDVHAIRILSIKRV